MTAITALRAVGLDSKNRSLSDIDQYSNKKLKNCKYDLGEKVFCNEGDAAAVATCQADRGISPFWQAATAVVAANVQAVPQETLDTFTSAVQYCLAAWA